MLPQSDRAVDTLLHPHGGTRATDKTRAPRTGAAGGRASQTRRRHVAALAGTVLGTGTARWPPGLAGEGPAAAGAAQEARAAALVLSPLC